MVLLARSFGTPCAQGVAGDVKFVMSDPENARETNFSRLGFFNKTYIGGGVNCQVARTFRGSVVMSNWCRATRKMRELRVFLDFSVSLRGTPGEDFTGTFLTFRCTGNSYLVSASQKTPGY